MENNIKKLRNELGMSRRELAHALGITVGAVSHYENGIRLPGRLSSSRLLELAKKNRLKFRLEDIYISKLENST